MIMNKAAILLILMLFAVSCGNNSGNQNVKNIPEGGNAEISFTDYEHGFGKVAEGEKLSWQFLFENKGTSDLVLTSVSTTCGCTVTKYDSKPVHPGEKGTIEVVFDTTGRNGMQTKTVTVKSNAKVPVVFLKITAEVEATE
jgi:hypothetical protein